MKKISNRDEANNYYKVVKKAVDKFSEETKSRPSEMHKYLSNNKKMFLKRLELDDVEGIENVFNDVLLHKKHLEDDKVITFESFSHSLRENLFSKSPNVEYEKILADYFNTSLGHIELIDSTNHIYKINDFGKTVFSVIIDDSELMEVKSKMTESITSDILGKVVNIDECESLRIPVMKFWLSDLIDRESMREKIKEKLSTNLVFDYFSRIVSQNLNVDFESGVQYSNFGNYHIWYK